MPTSYNSIRVDNNLPTGMITLLLENNQASLFEEIIDIIDLAHSLVAKLEHMINFVQANHEITFINCLSDSDKYILQKAINSGDLECTSAWLVLIQTNQITSALKLEGALAIDKHKLISHDRKTYTNFYKWFNLGNEHDRPIAVQKIQAIVNSNAYLASPQKFNDILDCKLNFLEEDILDILDEFKTSKETVSKIKHIFNNLPRVCSFSINNPTSINSNIMWGLYGNCGSGFAISYNILNAISTIFTNYFDIKTTPFLHAIPKNEGQKYIRFTKVQYNDNSLHNQFKNLLRQYLKEKDIRILFDFMRGKFLSIKSTPWQYEQEFRMFKIIDPKQYFTDAEFDPIWTNTSEEFNNILSTRLGDESICLELFAVPNNIILGWNCSLESDNIKSLINYAKNQSISIVRLTGNICHTRSEFENKPI